MILFNKATMVSVVMISALAAACSGSLASSAQQGSTVPVVPRSLPIPPVSTLKQPIPTLPVLAAPKPVAANPWAWTHVPLTGDNKAFAKARKQIDTAVSQGRDPEVLLEKYRTAGELSPGDPLVLFRWAYAAYITATRQTTTPEVFQCIKGLSDPRYAVAPVPSYDFNRVRFLIASLTAPNPALADLGRRLLAINQDDDAVEYALAGILLDTFNPPKTVEALGLAQDLINQEANRAEPYALVGEIYYLRWKAHHRPKDAQQASAAYQQYVQLAPDTDGFKKKAASLVAAINFKLKSSGN
jgi:hypothetical protein